MQDDVRNLNIPLHVFDAQPMPRWVTLLSRRLRRLPIFRLTRHVQSCIRNAAAATAPRKHVKIDDEERPGLLDDEAPQSFFGQTKARRLLNMLLLLLLLLLLLVLGTLYVVYRPPHLLVQYLSYRNPDVTFHISIPSTTSSRQPDHASRKLLALTIDDAPSSHTGALLDLLAAHGAHATFFIIGSQIASYPEIVQRIHDEGHEVGNHAWRDEPSVGLSIDELRRQLRSVDELLPANRPLHSTHKTSNVDTEKSDDHTSSSSSWSHAWSARPRYFRPGSGFFSSAMVATARALGHRTVLGDVYPHDAQLGWPAWNARFMLGRAQPGSVVIMHDRRAWSAEQLRRLLEGLDTRGYRAGSLGEVFVASGLDM